MATSATRQLNQYATKHNEPLRIADVRTELGVSRERLARVLDVSSRTVARWEEQDQLPANRWIRQVLVQLHNIAELGHESLSPAGFRALMDRPQPAFGNRSGIEAIEQGDAEMVYRELAGLAEGLTGT